MLGTQGIVRGNMTKFLFSRNSRGRCQGRNKQHQATMNGMIKNKARYEAVAFEEVTLGSNMNEVTV